MSHLQETTPASALLDRRHAPAKPAPPWGAHIVRSGEIEAAVAGLSSGAPGEDGRREALIVHPCAQAPGLGLAPGVAVCVGVLLPGEATRPRRTNASAFTMLLKGAGRAEVGGAIFELTARDGWNTPGMNAEVLANAGDAPLVYLSYSNAPLLEKLAALYVELDPPSGETALKGAESIGRLSARVRKAKEIAGPAVDIGGGAMLLPYEHLIDPEFVQSKPLHWPWSEIAPRLGLVRALGQGYTGRPLWCLYNPATERRNGTTFCFFATVASVAPDLVGPAHRHVSAAINYILDGSGWSVVDGRRMDWAAGDIMLSAPGWAPHGHASGPDGAVILTVQDHPLHIGTESLIWQEDLAEGPIHSLGAEAGFETNLAQFRPG